MGWKCFVYEVRNKHIARLYEPYALLEIPKGARFIAFTSESNDPKNAIEKARTWGLQCGITIFDDRGNINVIMKNVNKPGPINEWKIVQKKR